MILGLNGYIWVSKHARESEREGDEGFDAEAVYSNRNDVGIASTCYSAHSQVSQDIDDATRTAIVRVGNIIRVLAIYFVPLTDTVLAEAYEWAIEQGSEYGVKDLLKDDVAEALVLAVTARTVV